MSDDVYTLVAAGHEPVSEDDDLLRVARAWLADGGVPPEAVTRLVVEHTPEGEIKIEAHARGHLEMRYPMGVFRCEVP